MELSSNNLERIADIVSKAKSNKIVESVYCIYSRDGNYPYVEIVAVCNNSSYYKNLIGEELDGDEAEKIKLLREEVNSETQVIGRPLITLGEDSSENYIDENNLIDHSILFMNIGQGISTQLLCNGLLLFDRFGRFNTLKHHLIKKREMQAYNNAFDILLIEQLSSITLHKPNQMLLKK